MDKVLTKEYQALPALIPFHRSKARERLLRAGLGSGKTVAGVHEVCRHVLETDKKHDVIVAAPTYQMLEHVVKREFFEWFPPEMILEYRKNDNILRVKGSPGKPGPTIFFRSADVPERIRGYNNVNFIWIDEGALTTRGFYLNLIGRIYRSGITNPRVIITTTPRWNWIKDLEEEFEKSKDCAAFHMTSLDNPHYPKEYIDVLRKRFGEEFFKQEVMAEYVKFSGLIYRNFEPERHAISWDEFVERTGYPDKGILNIVRGIDFGVVHPFVCLWCAIAPDGTFYIYRELYQKQALITDMANEMKRYPDRVLYTIADSEDYQSILMLNSSGIPCARADKLGNDKQFPMTKKIAGINRVQAMLAEGRLFIVRSCPQTIREMSLYHWKDTQTEDLMAQYKAEPDRKDSDTMDALRYIINSQPPVPAQNRKDEFDPNVANVRKILEYKRRNERLRVLQSDADSWIM